MILTHWNYFLAIEQDAEQLSRYVEFASPNFNTYSVEIARLLMTATQEVDVLMKQICQQNGNSSAAEAGYRAFISKTFPAITSIEVWIPRYDLEFMPYEEWGQTPATTPSWWTANNKVKHQRHTDFARASLENMLKSLSGLLVANLYYYAGDGKLSEVWPGARLFYPNGMVASITPTPMGMKTNYKIP